MYLKNKKIKILHIYTIMLNKLKLRKMKADIKWKQNQYSQD